MVLHLANTKDLIQLLSFNCKNPDHRHKNLNTFSTQFHQNPFVIFFRNPRKTSVHRFASAEVTMPRALHWLYRPYRRAYRVGYSVLQTRSIVRDVGYDEAQLMRNVSDLDIGHLSVYRTLAGLPASRDQFLAFCSCCCCYRPLLASRC